MLELAIRPAAALTDDERAAILDLCSLAYEEDFAPYLALMPDIVHVLGRRQGTLVSHAGWVTRWLQPAGMAPLRTAYVEAVATLPEAQGRGHATAILAALPPLLGDFDVAALSPSESGFYARLGWQLWRGPLLVREGSELVGTPEEEVMVLPLRRTPPLDLAAPVSIEWRPGEVW